MWSKVLTILSRLIPRPGRGRFVPDSLSLLFIVSLQTLIIPSVTGVQYIDLVTPWLVYNFIVLGTTTAMVQGFIGAIALEGHGSSPAGLYLCSYWIMGLCIIMVKKHISWRNLMPWITTLMVSQLWILLFETFVFLVKTSSFEFFNLSSVSRILVRLMFTFGMVFLLSGIKPEQTGEEKTV